MLEEGVSNMDKKSSRQSSVPPKNGATSDSKKNDANSPNRFGKYGRKRESGGARGGAPDFVRRPGPTPQKSRTSGDKRPRSRGYYNDRQREEVTEAVGPEYGSPLFTNGSKKGSLNHLLNFTFASRNEANVSSFGGQRAGRRPRHGGRVYNKERFLQANCQFVVGHEGDYTIHSIDADTLVDWNLVEQVRTLSNEPPTCPICLQEPQAGKITRCGHIFCWACILHYLALGEKAWRKCPICYDSIVKDDLKSVQIRVVHTYKPGETITLRLMKREKGTTYSVPKSQWEKRDGIPHRIDDAVNTEFVKLLVASPAQIQETIIEPERMALEKHMETAEDSEVCFIESAMELLKAREETIRITARQQKIQEVVEPDESVQEAVAKTKSSDSTPVKIYASAFSDREESDDDAIESPATGIDAQEVDAESQNSLSKPLIQSSVLSMSKEVSAGGKESGTEYEDSAEKSVNSSEDEHHISEVSNFDGTPEEESSDLIVENRSIDTAPGNDVPIDIQRERTSLSDSSVGSPEGFPTTELQARLHHALPVEEAAEHLELPAESELRKDGKGKNKPKTAFFYYQASDGQHIYIHSLNARCLVKEYGSLEDCPDSITAVILDTERIFMTEDLRKRLRYLNHLPLTCEFQVAELVLKPPLLSRNTLKLFTDDFERRRRMRQRKMRDDKKRSKKIEAEENAKIGKFPEMKISISSFSQFPSADTSLQAQMPLSPVIRPESPSVSSLASSPPASPASGWSATGGLSSEGHSDGEQTSMSFAQMLKAGKSKPQNQPVWPKAPEPAPHREVPVQSPGSDESDSEDRVPVPVYQDSFSSAIQAALDTRDKSKEMRPGTGGRKKKQKFTKLFATSMTRGK